MFHHLFTITLYIVSVTFVLYLVPLNLFIPLKSTSCKTQRWIFKIVKLLLLSSSEDVYSILRLIVSHYSFRLEDRYRFLSQRPYVFRINGFKPCKIDIRQLLLHNHFMLVGQLFVNKSRMTKENLFVTTLLKTFN